jgi:ABC-type Na+ efflux pump, permease component
MKSNIITIMKKELSRFLGDKRVLFSSILLPGLMIYVMYSFMGNAMGSMFGHEERAPQVSAVQMPASVNAMFEAQALPYEVITPEQGDLIAEVKTRIAEKEHDLLLVFPADFDALVAAYDITSGDAAPNIDIFYNSTETASSELYAQICAILDGYEATLSNKFDINNTVDARDYASEKDVSAMLFSSMMPLLLTIFLFSGCMAVAPESIAGEKERGTLATLLVTPMRRYELALGKIFAITIISVLGAASSTIGTVLSLPKLMGGAADGMAIFYTANDYLLLALVIVSTVLLFVSMISIISAFARSVKESQTYVMPLMVVVMLVGVSGMFGSIAANPLLYLVPVFNSVQCMSSVFAFEISSLNIIITVVSNLIYCALLSFVLTRMFNSEKVMFSR